MPPPKQINIPQSRPASQELQAVMNDQVQKGLWRPVQAEDQVKWISRAFAIPKPQGEGHRLLVDHSKLSKFILAPHFKMSGIKDVLALLQPNALLAKIDLSNAYGQIPLSKQTAAYLVASTGNQLWWPLGMPQGTSCAPFIFTSIIKTVWRGIRKEGIQIVGYLDDCIVIMPQTTLEEAQQQLKTAINHFTQLGFKINPQKTSSAPTHVVTFLGMELNTVEWTIKWPKPKREAVQRKLKNLLQGTHTPRFLAEVVGALKAASPAWPTVHLETFLLQREVAQLARQGWDTKTPLSTQAYREARRIYKLLDQEIVTPITQGKIQATLTTDAASSYGWGATLKIGEKEWKYAERWTKRLQGKHSTELEMRAVANAMLHFQPLIHNCKLLIQSDCSTVVWDITRKRVGSENLRAIVMQILCLAEKLNINLTCSHLAGVLNVVTDQLSRTETHSGLVLRAEAFAQVQEELGPCTVDAFATRTNAKLPRFISWLPDPEAIGQDFFSLHLDRKELYYVFPPIALLLRALAKIRDEQVQAVVIAPGFPDQVWTPLLRSGTCKSIDLGTEALVPNQAAAELPRNTRMIAYRWGKLEPSLEPRSVRALGPSMTMPSDSGHPSA